MKLSVIIPFHKDDELISAVVMALLANRTDVYSKDIEIIVVNDGSKDNDGKFKPLELEYRYTKVINNPVSYGIGYSFDRGVSECTGDIIVLMGADVFVNYGWDTKVIELVNSNPESIGCAVCVNPDNGKKHYGAELLIQMGMEDLPEKSKLRICKSYTSIFEAQWRKTVDTEPTEIPCLLGAFYWTTKAFYNLIRGWDTEKGVKFKGHIFYGALEPYLSLKTWLSGGSCILYPDIEVDHVFNRADGKAKFTKGVRSADKYWFNKLFIAHTMILDEDLRDKILAYPNSELNLNVARKYIKQNFQHVESVRDSNKRLFTKGLWWFMDKFGYKLK